MSKELVPMYAPGRPHPLGATVVDGGVNFSLYSRATAVELLLFDLDDRANPSLTIDLDPVHHRTDNYWHVFVPRIAPGTLYGYRVDGPYLPEEGLRYDRSKVLLDPYAKAVIDDDYDRERAARHGESNLGASMLGAVVDPSAYDWEGDEPLRRRLAGGAIYELHVRGFTRQRSSGVRKKRRGTYAGVIEKIPHLKRLGVEMVELLPVYQFDRDSAAGDLRNYWGYQPVAFFAPHRGYSSRRRPERAVDEFRDMVKALHRAGIEVILDVVYNHTAEDGVGGPTLSMRGLDNPSYYLLPGDDPSGYVNDSGVGNTINGNHTIVRRLIIDSLRYWVEEMHVDGFRFDLASVLSRGADNVPLADPPILWDIDTDPVLAGTKIIAEAWDAAGLYQVGSFAGDRWAVWNGPFRDTVRRFVKSDRGTVEALADSIAGSPRLFARPMRGVNFVTAHDGFTLNDLVSYDHKHNEANGEDNRDGTEQNHSWNCGVEGPTDDPEVESLRRRQIRNLFTILLLAQGRPMFVMGDEARRTQHGNNNGYCQDSELSWLDWDLVDEHEDLVDFVARLLRYRSNSAFHRDDRFWSQPGGADVTWHGVELDRPDWGGESHSLALELTYRDRPEHLYVALNAYWEPLEFALPTTSSGRTWAVGVNTAADPPDDVPSPPSPLADGTTRLWVAPRSSVALGAIRRE